MRFWFSQAVFILAEMWQKLVTLHAFYTLDYRELDSNVNNTNISSASYVIKGK